MEATANSSNQSETEEKTFRTMLEPSEKGLLNNNPQNKLANKKSSKKDFTIFLVDDDPLYLNLLEHYLIHKLPSVRVKKFQTGEDCLEQIKLKPEVVILDFYLNSKIENAQDGLFILKEIIKINPKTKVIMLSSQDSLDIAVRCIDNGSFDYLAKDKYVCNNLYNELIGIIDHVKTHKRGMKPYHIIFFKENKIFFN